MPDPTPAAASSLPRTLEMALKICDFDATVWARRVVVAPDDWAWLSVVFDAGRLWIVELTPTDDAAEVPRPELGPAWTEADRNQFEHASLAAQYATLTPQRTTDQVQRDEARPHHAGPRQSASSTASAPRRIRLSRPPRRSAQR